MLSRTSMTLVGGKALDLAAPSHERIHYNQIAWSLADKGRFGDQSPVKWPVGNHVICCAILAAYHHATGPAKFCGTALPAVRAAFHHDDGEAFYGDSISPVNQFLKECEAYQNMRRAVDNAITQALNLDAGHLASEEVHMYDLIMLEAERQSFFLDAEDVWPVTEMVKDEPLLPLAKKLVAKMAMQQVPQAMAARRLRGIEETLLAYNPRSTPVELYTDLLLFL